MGEIRIEYGVILPTWPEAIIVVKPVGEDRLMVFVGKLQSMDTAEAVEETRSKTDG